MSLAAPFAWFARRSPDVPAAADTMPGSAEPAPQWATDRLRTLRRQLLAEQQTVEALRRQLSAATSLPTTPAGLASELVAVRADRDRLERINDRLRAELAEARAKIPVP